ncbi:hypothetical protein BN1708_017514, partial [Verticillium longisporum]
MDRISVPYPSFSKAHSKEAVSREDLSGSAAGRRSGPLTPEPTDLGGEEKERSKSADYSTASRSKTKEARPPSPPETDVSALGGFKISFVTDNIQGGMVICLIVIAAATIGALTDIDTSL